MSAEWTIEFEIAAHVKKEIFRENRLVERWEIYQKAVNEEPEIDDFTDERDDLIDLRGTKVTYSITSFGSLIAMLTFVMGQPPLIMFTLLVLSGLVAQIIGDINRLRLYRRGF